jgi:type VI secretion system secreted protein VgrG
VLIDFLEGNIDRPVVLGTVYNGRGQADAQHNQVAGGAGVATGNAPAWFPGEAGGHAHPAALSGIKTQALQSSQGGSGAYNQLVFDDSPGQSRLGLQRHATAHQGTAELNLGHLLHQSDNQRLKAAGFGAELKTEHGVAVRAGKGLLLSTDARGSATGSQMDSREAIAQLEESLQLQTDLAEMAQKHAAPATGTQAAAPTGPLPAVAQTTHSIEVLGAVESDVPAYSEPHLQLSSPAGIAATTPANAVLGASATSSLTAGHDINFASQRNSYASVKDGIKLFTYGKATNTQKPNQEIGIRLHAASGKVSSQSQSNETKLTADKALTVVSTTKSINISGKQHVMMTAQGAYLKLEGGNIQIHGPGKIDFKASMKELTGPQDGSAGAPTLPKAKDIFNEAFVVKNEKTGEIMANVPYRMESAGGVVIEGITDAMGRTKRLFTSKQEEVKLFLKDQD